MSMAIRALGPADWALFRSIRLEALAQTPEAFGSSLTAEAAQPPEFFAGRLAGSTVFGGFEGEALQGIAGFRQNDGPKERHKAMLWGMYVRPASRGGGLARDLVAAVLAHARGRVELVQLTVVAGNEPALRLYTAAGFAEYGREHRSLKQDGQYFDEILMAVDIA
jgi:RimJ/RimL family protein N-acetyltransferase